MNISIVYCHALFESCRRLHESGLLLQGSICVASFSGPFKGFRGFGVLGLGFKGVDCPHRQTRPLKECRPLASEGMYSRISIKCPTSNRRLSRKPESK